MARMDEYHKYFKKLEIIQEFMVGDLRRTSKNARANFLIAMGVFNYIEILGSFYKYKTKYRINKKSQTGIPRFDFAINELFNSVYKQEFKKIRRLFGKPPYDMFRSGMTHEYLVKTYKGQTGNILSFTVINPNINDDEGYNNLLTQVDCGIKVDQTGNKRYKISIICPKLIEDFNDAFEEYKRRLISDQGKYRDFFILRARDINLDLVM